MFKKFFYVCGGVLMLVMAIQFGAKAAEALSTNSHWPIVGVAPGITKGTYLAIDTNGDAFVSRDEGATWTLQGSVHPVKEYDPQTGKLK